MFVPNLYFVSLCFMSGILLIDSLKITRKYETKKFKVPLDHFSFVRNETFEIRYLVNNSFWDQNNSGPIFFYTGNEGQIELFAEYAGFVWDIAEEFNALVIFAEHRYYGQSMPFGNNSLDAEHVGYLTSSQALADYADLVDFLQGDGLKPKYPVVAFGGSYGGMLSAYFRMKYPHLVTGAIAASAPIHQFTGMVPCDAFNRIVTSSFGVANNDCVSNIRKSWNVLRNITKSDEGKKWLSAEWKLCSNITNQTDIETMVAFLSSMYTTLAMVNYPYECDFLTPLPGHPVKTSCQFLKDPLDDKPLLQALGKVLNLFNNYTKTSTCTDYKGNTNVNLDAGGWDFQACTEMVMPMCSTGINDMFEPVNVSTSQKAFEAECLNKFHVKPSPRLAYVEYGGNNIEAASNIVFSNGLLDPWASGGVLTSISDTVRAIIIVDGAHHLDLMPAHENDPFSVVSARNIHKDNIRRWIREFRVNKFNKRN